MEFSKLNEEKRYQEQLESIFQNMKDVFEDLSGFMDGLFQVRQNHREHNIALLTFENFLPIHGSIPTLKNTSPHYEEIRGKIENLDPEIRKLKNYSLEKYIDVYEKMIEIYLKVKKMYQAAEAPSGSIEAYLITNLALYKDILNSTNEIWLQYLNSGKEYNKGPFGLCNKSVGFMVSHVLRQN